MEFSRIAEAEGELIDLFCAHKGNVFMSMFVSGGDVIYCTRDVLYVLYSVHCMY